MKDITPIKGKYVFVEQNIYSEGGKHEETTVVNVCSENFNLKNYEQRIIIKKQRLESLHYKGAYWGIFFFFLCMSLLYIKQYTNWSFLEYFAFLSFFLFFLVPIAFDNIKKNEKKDILKELEINIPKIALRFPFAAELENIEKLKREIERT